MTNKTSVGLDKNDSVKLSKKLNILLSNYTVFYHNVRAYHWNIKGDLFFLLHEKFEELYNDLKLKIDEIAERMLTLDDTPEHKMSEYIKISDIDETDFQHDGKVAVKEIVESFQVLLTLQRELLELSDKAGDEGTNALMSDYITEQEKLVWMYRSNIS